MTFPWDKLNDAIDTGYDPFDPSHEPPDGFYEPMGIRSEPKAVIAGSCPRCLSLETTDIVLNHSPHNGDTVRRDCGKCGLFLEWVRWYAT